MTDRELTYIHIFVLVVTIVLADMFDSKYLVLLIGTIFNLILCAVFAKANHDR